VVQLHRDIAKLRAAGAEMIVIGNGGPSFLAGFREQTGWDGPLYTDPSLTVYRAAGLKRGMTRTFHPFALGGTIRALARGARQGRTQGDPWQQGGVIVVARDGRVRWHHAADHSADNPSADDIAAALS
jgi:hypothetical protein